MAQSASFRRGLPTVLLSLALPGAALVTGCDSDTNRADKKVAEQLDQAVIQMGGSASDRDKANTQLDSAAKEIAASLPVQLGAKAALADSELQLAQGLIEKIQANDLLIDRLAREIGLLSNEIQVNNEIVAGLSKRQPTAVQAAVAANTASLKGSDDKPDWYKSDANTLSSLAGDDKQIASVQADISKLQDTIKSESDQRNQLLDEADKLSQQSLHEKKEKSVDLYTRGSESRKRAADLTVKLDLDNAALTRAQADLALQQGQHDSLTASLKSLDDKSGLIDADWKNAQQQMSDLGASSKSLLGDDPVTAPAVDAKGDLKTDPTVASKASAIVELSKKNHDLRTGAQTHFNNAIGMYKDALGLANKIKQEIGDKKSKANDQKPDQTAWSTELDAFEPSTYRFLQADAELQKADFESRNASEAKTRLDLETQVKSILTAARLTPPPTLDDTDGALAAQLKNAQTAAADSYKSATDELGDIFDGGGSQDIRNAAKIHEIFGQYGWSLLATSQGDTSDAATHLAAARNAIQAATAAGASLPILPPALVQQPAGKTAPKPPAR